ncbi:hypothetical protein DER29_3237 [Micromonospora sp. M71_S20]|uniref:hypothetical protein n=1 Tax=Micromonospora sp. M71_S20 TaxID=592872 RepID=UPI000F24430F|nr:hypothetical protein [Micromonospora sp. M71_S20]RLK25247.1 hypothetical protein DER29_3237 [Micromonospora sp. M71_S20]
MQPTAESRGSFLIRLSGPIAWTIWAVSAVIVVVIAVERAPLHTFGDWGWLALVIAMATVIPLLLVLSMHQLALTGVGRFLAYLVLTTIVLILLWFFGWQVLDWYEAADSGFHGFSGRVVGYLIFVSAPGLGLGILAGHLELARAVARKALRSQQGGDVVDR